MTFPLQTSPRFRLWPDSARRGPLEPWRPAGELRTAVVCVLRRSRGPVLPPTAAGRTSNTSRASLAARDTAGRDGSQLSRSANPYPRDKRTEE